MLWTALLLCVTVVPDAPAAGCCPAPRARPSYTGPPPWQQGRSRRTQRMKSPQSIVITGGSSGIGEALALAYAAPGIVLALTGRDAGRLEAVAGRCRAKGATVATGTLDVRDPVALADWLAAVDRDHPLDLVIANAGISAGTGTFGETDRQARDIKSDEHTSELQSLMRISYAVFCLKKKKKKNKPITRTHK